MALSRVLVTIVLLADNVHSHCQAEWTRFTWSYMRPGWTCQSWGNSGKGSNYFNAQAPDCLRRQLSHLKWAHQWCLFEVSKQSHAAWKTCGRALDPTKLLDFEWWSLLWQGMTLSQTSLWKLQWNFPSWCLKNAELGTVAFVLAPLLMLLPEKVQLYFCFWGHCIRLVFANRIFLCCTPMNQDGSAKLCRNYAIPTAFFHFEVAHWQSS